MNEPARVIKRPALLGMVAVTAIIVALAASWSLAARAEAMRPGWGAKAMLILVKGPPETETESETESES